VTDIVALLEYYCAVACILQVNQKKLIWHCSYS